MCSMSLTVVVNTRSNGPVMRSPNCDAGIPVYWNTMETTGMSMFGKISLGVRTIANAPAISSSSAATTNVYGRLRASLTIHIKFCPLRPVDREGESTIPLQ